MESVDEVLQAVRAVECQVVGAVRVEELTQSDVSLLEASLSDRFGVKAHDGEGIGCCAEVVVEPVAICGVRFEVS